MGARRRSLARSQMGARSLGGSLRSPAFARLARGGAGMRGDVGMARMSARRRALEGNSVGPAVTSALRTPHFLDT